MVDGTGGLLIMALGLFFFLVGWSLYGSKEKE